MDKINILFLGGAKRVSLAQSLKKYGKSINREVSIFSYELEYYVPIKVEAEVIIGLKWSDENIIEDLINVINKYKIDIVLPFVDPAISIASRLNEECENVFIPISSRELCDILFDKIESSRWFKQKSIPQPPVYNNQQELELPFIIKPRFGSASKGITICENFDDMPDEIDFENNLVQKYINDRIEYSVDCYVSQKAEIVSIVPRIRIETLGGESIRSITVRKEEIIELSKKVLSADNFRGPITLQFIEDLSSGEFHIMEINPRLGGAVLASINAGSGLEGFIIDEALNKDIMPVQNWRENTLMVRYFKEVLFYEVNN